MSLALALSLLLAAPDAGVVAPNPQLQSTMRLSFSALARLQPYLLSPPAFRDPANTAAIKGDLDVLGRLQHQFQKGNKGPAADALAGLFADQVGRARAELNGKAFEAARMRLHGLSGLCVSCHQRQQADKDFEDAQKIVDRLKLDTLQRAEFYAATRQFDRALKTWKEALGKPPVGDAAAMEHARAIRSALGVAVRVKDDPRAVLELLTPLQGQKELPGFVRVNLGQWLAEAKAWQNEKVAAGTLSAQAAFDRAKGLLLGSGAMDSVVSDERFYLSHLRAAAYLNEALTLERSAAWRTEAFYLLGVATAAISEPALWELDGLYLETCVREAPHTSLAQRCVQRLADRVIFAYTTRAGLELPADQTARLSTLRALAE